MVIIIILIIILFIKCYMVRGPEKMACAFFSPIYLLISFLLCPSISILLSLCLLTIETDWCRCDLNPRSHTSTSGDVPQSQKRIGTTHCSCWSARLALCSTVTIVTCMCHPSASQTSITRLSPLLVRLSGWSCLRSQWQLSHGQSSVSISKLDSSKIYNYADLIIWTIVC